MTIWIPKTTNWIITEIQRLASTHLWKKYTKAELRKKCDLSVKQYKLQCKLIWRIPDKRICKQRENKVLYAILESIKKEIRRIQKWKEQTTLF